jgi:DNA-binding NtrC family response regulator
MTDSPTAVLGDSREIRFPRFRLEVIEGPDSGQTLDVAASEISIGTSRGNDLVLVDSAVSRHHIAITPHPRGPLIRDLGSTNGTFVSGVQIERAYLAAGSAILLGNTRLRFDAAAGEERALLSPDDRWSRALGTSEAMRRLFAVLPRLAESDSTVLLEGETGTGKTMLAAAIHDASPRARGPFIVVDCGAVPPSLIESELFGHERGAFTGATSARAGAFEAANGGTVFLDEIGELPLDLQPKLLRALEDRVVKRVGGNESLRVDLRIIAATNRDLRSEINRGRFRSDLYYRLNTFRLRMPPLRERRDDIALLASHFYRQLAGDEPPASLIVDFCRHDWPGNVRELRAAVERTVLLGDPTVWRQISEDVPPTAPASVTAATAFDPTASFRVAKERAVAAWERDYVRALIAAHEGNVSAAARAVRMDRNHLRELLVRHKVRATED